jgi:hypothetical protein
LGSNGLTATVGSVTESDGKLVPTDGTALTSASTRGLGIGVGVDAAEGNGVDAAKGNGDGELVCRASGGSVGTIAEAVGSGPTVASASDVGSEARVASASDPGYRKRMLAAPMTTTRTPTTRFARRLDISPALVPAVALPDDRGPGRPPSRVSVSWPTFADVAAAIYGLDVPAPAVAPATG